MTRAMFRGLLQSTAGGGGVGATPWDDEFSVGSSIDTAGTRFAGANPWFDNVGAIVAPVVAKGYAAGEFFMSLGTNGVSYETRNIMQGTLPAGDWTFETDVHLQVSSWYALAGFIFYENATGKSVVFGPGEDLTDRNIRVHNNSVADAHVTVGSWTTEYSSKLRVSRSGSNLVYDYDIGSGWVNACTVAQTLRFTTAPDYIGLVYVHSVPNTGTKTAYYRYFRKTA